MYMLNVQLIKTVLKERGLTYKQFSEKIEMSFETVKSYMALKRNPSLRVLMVISKVLEIELNDLLVG